MNKIKRENLTEFKLSSDGDYWIGTTSKNDEFYFSGNNETIEYIKTWNWRKRTDGYFQNYKGERLHRVVMGVTNSKIIIDHINNIKADNRLNNLRKATRQENNRNKETHNEHGVVGLSKRGNLYYGTININNRNIRTKGYQDKEKAIIDLLIVQRCYNYTHNEHLFYLLEGISKNITTDVLSSIKTKLNNPKQVQNNRQYKNEYILSEDGTYYIVYCNKKDNFYNFKISFEDKAKIDSFYWSIMKGTGNKYYIRSTQSKSLLHRFLFDLNNEDKYGDFYIDHIDGDSLNNTRKNLIITDKKGNNTNINGKGYHKTNNGKFRASISKGEYNSKKSKVFEREEDARNWYLREKEEEIMNRNIWENKESLDIFLDKTKVS